MAGYIKGITIEFGADTTKLNGALKKTNGALTKTQAELKAVNRSLKFNPGNTTLLKQKFDLLKKSVVQTEGKLKELRNLQATMAANGVDKNSAQWRELEREIIKTENNLKQAEAELRRFGSVGKQQALAVGSAFQAAGSKIKSAGRTITTTVSVYGVAGIYAGSKLIELSQKQAQAEQKLTEIYKTRMGATDGAAKSTMRLASSLQQQGVVGDEVALSFAQQMATYSSAPSTVNTLLPAFENLLVQQKGLNGTQEDAVGLANMFGKAMMGQTGALKRAGISFTDAQAEVLKYGTEEEKAAMMAEVITQNVGNMNAEFAKTDAGKIQQAKNTIGDMGEEIGAVLLPAVADLASWIGDHVLPKIQELIEWLQQHPAVAKFALAFAAITAVAGPLIMIFGGLISAIGSLISIVAVIGPVFAAVAAPVGIAVAAIAAAIAIGVLLYKNWDKIKKQAVKIWAAIKKAVTTPVIAIKNAVTTNFNTLKTFVTTVFTKLKTTVTTLWNNIKTAIVTPITAAKNAVVNIVNAIKAKFPLNLGKILKGIDISALSNAWDKIKNIASSIKGKFPLNLGKIVKGADISALSNAWEKIKGIASKLKSKFPLSVGKIFSNIKLPHFKVSGKAPYGLGGKGTKPSISVAWYKKAMQQPYLFSNATLFGAGERGDEMLYGRTALMKDIASAVGGASMGGVVVNVYGSDNMSVNDLAYAVEQRLITMQKRRTQAWA